MRYRNPPPLEAAIESRSRCTPDRRVPIVSSFPYTREECKVVCKMTSPRWKDYKQNIERKRKRRRVPTEKSHSVTNSECQCKYPGSYIFTQQVGRLLLFWLEEKKKGKKKESLRGPQRTSNDRMNTNDACSIKIKDHLSSSERERERDEEEKSQTNYFDPEEVVILHNKVPAHKLFFPQKMFDKFLK